MEINKKLKEYLSENIKTDFIQPRDAKGSWQGHNEIINVDELTEGVINILFTDTIPVHYLTSHGFPCGGIVHSLWWVINKSYISNKYYKEEWEKNVEKIVENLNDVLKKYKLIDKSKML